ncbi:gephyrin-like molybdotransferase Glp [Kaustia mangrovi]
MSMPPKRLLDDCFLHDRDRLRHEEALALIAERIRPVAGVEEVALEAAHGRILAEPVAAPRNVPAFDNAAVDGYAFSARDVDPDAVTALPLGLRMSAGDPVGLALKAGTAARIFTGAPVPKGADTVIMQEDAVRSGDRVEIPAGVRQGANIRKAGEDLAEGEAVVEAGTRLRPQELAAVASTGCDRVVCRERLRVALVSTGDEVVRPGAVLRPGQVYDSNHYLLRGLLETVGAEIHDMGILPDDETVVREAVGRAAQSAHAIVTTGGASRGEADHIVSTISELGALHAWQLAIKPGRPLAFGQIGETVFLGFPGNPVAVFVCFLLYGRPLLAGLQGASWQAPRGFLVPAGFEIARKKPDRREFLRGWVEETADGPVARKFPRDGSGLISGLRAADGLIELPEEVTRIAPGDPVRYLPFSAFGVMPR